MKLRPLTILGAIALLVSLLALSGCSVLDGDDEPAAPKASALAEVAVTSQFTQDGTFQSHISPSGFPKVDFVYTLYPTKSTPRTNEWFPKGNKFFSFTFQGYDLSQKLRAPFATKRKIYLDTIKVTSATTTVDGGRTQHPYKLNAEAKQITFDPEAVSTKYGMLITSPKGAFELRNQKIRQMSADTRAVTLTFTAKVNIETSAGSGNFASRVIKQKVPIAIFASDERTEVAKIPVDAN